MLPSTQSPTVPLVVECSFLHRLLITNDVPSTQEQKILRTALHKAEHTLSDLDKENDRLEAAKRELEASIDDVQQRRHETIALIKFNVSLSSCIRQFPREIIAEIILHALNHYNGDTWPIPATFDTHNGPWKFSQVSTLWREVALSLTQIWSFMDLNRYSMNMRNPDAIISIMHRRSVERPLTIRFEKLDFKDVSLSVAKIIMEQCDRWKYVHCFLIPHGPLCDAVRGNVPALERLVLESPDGIRAVLGHLRPGSIVTDVFEIAPRLRHITLEVPGTVNPVIPWEQITHYEEAYVRYRPSGILPRLTSVVECKLTATKAFGPGKNTPVILPRMHTLSVQTPGCLSRLRLPSLRNLTVCEGARHSLEVWELLKRSEIARESLNWVDVEDL